MGKKDITLVDKISNNLFRSSGEAEIELTVDELEIKKRYMLVITKWLDDPLVRDSEMVTLLKEEMNIEKSQAYKDLSNIKLILGNIKNATKEWHRYQVVEKLKESYQRAKEAGNVIAEIMALDKIGKYTKLDKDDEEPMPWDQIIPADFAMSDDVKVLDPKLNRISDDQRQTLRQKYNSAIDTEYSDV